MNKNEKKFLMLAHVKTLEHLAECLYLYTNSPAKSFTSLTLINLVNDVSEELKNLIEGKDE